MQKIKSYHLAPILIFAIFVFSSLKALIPVDAGASSVNIFLSQLILQIVIFLLPAVFYLRLRGNGLFPRLRLRLFRPGCIAAVLLASVVLFLGSAILKLTAIYINGADYSPVVSTANLNAASLIYVLVLFCALPAVLEEFIFRGILLAEYDGYGAFLAVLMTSLLFAMLHFSFTDFLSYFWAGIVLAVVTYLTRSVAAAMIVHFINNLFVVFLENILWSMIRQPDNIILFLFIMISLFLFFLFLFLNSSEYIVYKYAYTDGKKTPAEQKTMPKTTLSALFSAMLSPAFVACFIYFIIAAIIAVVKK